MARFAVLIVAAGKGERAGASQPKQYEFLSGLPMLRRTVQAFPPEYGIRVVIGPSQEALAAAALEGLGLPDPVLGGATRQESVRLGLEALAAAAPNFVLIHDAARPLVSPAVIARVAEALEQGYAGAVPMVAMADTLRRREGDGFVPVLRDGLFRAQTPQGFRFEDIRAAHWRYKDREVTDDMALAELAGIAVAMTTGEDRNIKITTKEDFAVAELLLARETRTAMGYDAHKFVPGDHVWLCGVKIPHDHALEGHSDADAGLHALTDAILGTIGAGDIGQHFPPTDTRWRGVSSDRFLAHAAGLVTEKGGSIVHCDVTIICEQPKVGPYREVMRTRIAEILKLPLDRVSVKATTTEGMGYIGRREGLAAQAIATVRI